MYREKLKGLDICGATWLFGGGAVLVWTWRVIERRSGVKDERDGRLVLCLWPTACSCGRHCGHAHLHTFGRSSGRQCRPRGVAPFKTEAKGRASRHPFYADTYPYIIWTTVHISHQRKRLVSPVSTCKYKQCGAGVWVGFQWVIRPGQPWCHNDRASGWRSVLCGALGWWWRGVSYPD